MLKVIYKIEDQYSVKTAAAEGALGRLEKQTRKAGKAAEKTGDRFTGVGSKLKTLGVAIAGFQGFRMLGRAIGGVIGDLARMEQSKLGLATMYRFNEVVGTIGEGMKKATGVLDIFVDMAKASPAGFEDFLAIYQNILPMMKEANATEQEQMELTRRTVMYASAMGIQFEEAGAAINQMLSGAAGIDNRMFRGMKANLGGTTEAWNALAKSDPTAAFQKLTNVLSRAGEAGDAAGKSFDGVYATLKDTLKLTAMEAAQPLFATMKKDMAALATWFAKNQRAVKEFTKSIGEGLVNAWTGLKDVLLFVVKHHEKLITLAKTFVAIWAGRKVAGALQAFGGARGMLGATAGRMGFGGAGMFGGRSAQVREMGGWTNVPGVGWSKDAYRSARSGGVSYGPDFQKAGRAQGIGLSARAGLQRAGGIGGLLGSVAKLSIVAGAVSIVGETVGGWLAEDDPFIRREKIAGADPDGLMASLMGIGRVGGVSWLGAAGIDMGKGRIKEEGFAGSADFLKFYEESLDRFRKKFFSEQGGKLAGMSGLEVQEFMVKTAEKDFKRHFEEELQQRKMEQDEMEQTTSALDSFSAMLQKATGTMSDFAAIAKIGGAMSAENIKKGLAQYSPVSLLAQGLGAAKQALGQINLKQEINGGVHITQHNVLSTTPERIMVSAKEAFMDATLGSASGSATGLASDMLTPAAA